MVFYQDYTITNDVFVSLSKSSLLTDLYLLKNYQYDGNGKLLGFDMHFWFGAIRYKFPFRVLINGLELFINSSPIK